MKNQFLPNLQMMPYLDYYGNCIEDDISSHVCQNCLNQAEEHAGIRRGALVRTTYYTTLAADPENITLWNAGIAAGNIVILPELRGTFDGGTPVLKAGWGDSKEVYTGSNYKATINDRVYKENWTFYRSLVGKSSWHLVYITESQGHLTTVPVTFATKAAVTEATDDVITWTTDATWFEYFQPAPFDIATIKNLFVCLAS
jgi:hypothetical protein